MLHPTFVIAIAPPTFVIAIAPPTFVIAIAPPTFVIAIAPPTFVIAIARFRVSCSLCYCRTFSCALQVAALNEHVRRARYDTTLPSATDAPQHASHVVSEREARANSELAHVRADKQRLEALLQVRRCFVVWARAGCSTSNVVQFM